MSPPLAEGLIRIAVRMASINYFDLLMVQGQYQRKPPLPFVTGTDAAGDVIEVHPSIKNLKSGDRVLAFNWLGGAFAQEMVVAAEKYASGQARWSAAALRQQPLWTVGSPSNSTGAGRRLR
jgi:NADPH:quinone reductase-like Zn-dependent oxidoreductase